MGSDADIAPGEHLKIEYPVKREGRSSAREVSDNKKRRRREARAPFAEPSMFHLPWELNLDEAVLKS